jgi:hypothetical protein
MDNYEMSVWMKIKALATWYLDFLLYVEAFSSLTVRSFHLAEQDIFHVHFACGASI